MRRLLTLLVALPALAASACSGGTPAPAPSPSAASSATAGTTAGATAGTPGQPRPPRHLVVHTVRWRLPYAVARAAVGPAGDGRYTLAGGLLAGDSSTDRVLDLDPAAGTVIRAGRLPVPVHDTAGARLGGQLLVVGGGNASEQGTVQVRHGGAWTVAGHLPQPRSDLIAATIGGRVLVLGGYDGTTTAMSAILASEDGRHWQQVGRLPLPVRYAASVVDGRSVWLFGGERAGVEQRAVQLVGADGHARVVARLPHPLGHAAAVRLGDRILLVGGRPSADRVTARMWWFDPSSRRFTPAGRLPRPLADTAVLTDGLTDGLTAWLVGGESPSLTDRVVRLSLR
ncbi:kelch repeat-containing protein [Nocardioides panaciterrulae]|uniref:Galactose oxidase n=1 Tax=Nocardioides panaciterrulae TaxID=661492 RepID=A0A7Y9E475_9ACTN|nr:kelch repeat-containing protein [Nocardioides panaciterrulae]NYD40864.1 hypothetical protein [Nocardioides panaciterrulae]